MYNNLWSKLPPRDKEAEIVRWIEKFRPQIEDLINESDDDVRHHFNYMTEVVEWNYIKLYDNGHEFSTANIDGFNNPGDLMMWVMQALNEYYYDYYEPDDPIMVDYTSIKHK